MSSRLGQFAVVIGAGIGGLSAAGAISPNFNEVVILERDPPPSIAQSRAGAPHDHHPHGLLVGGLQALCELFHGFDADLRDAGAASVYVFGDVRYERADVGPLPQRDLGVSLLCASRPLIELVLRRRVASVANISLLPQCRATGIAASTPGAARRLVKFESCAKGAAVVEADFVVDASGRGGLTLGLLDALGIERPNETVVGVDISYTTIVLPQPASPDWKLLVTLADPPSLVRGGLITPTENDLCRVSVFEHGARGRPLIWDEFLVALQQLNTRTIYDAVRDLPPPERLRHFVFDESRWRHFECMDHLVRGVLPFGDSICRFNPIYGQGMSVAARQAKLLRDVLSQSQADDDPISAVQTRFMSAIGPLLEVPWNMGMNADFAYPTTRGERPKGFEEGRAFEAALFRATVTDPVVQCAFFRRDTAHQAARSSAESGDPATYRGTRPTRAVWRRIAVADHRIELIA